MKKNKWILISGISFFIGVLLYFLNLNQFQLNFGNTNINIYPAAFFLFLGLLVAARQLIKKMD